MKEFYYYEPRLNDPERKRRVTVCLLVGSEDNDSFAGYPFARGVAICSDKDNFSKKIGRAIAKGRATKALLKGNCRKIRRSEIKESLPEEFQFKATVRPDQTGLTAMEAFLIDSMLTPKEEVA